MNVYDQGQLARMNVCDHGQLGRQCEICDLTAQLTEAKAECAALRASQAANACKVTKPFTMSVDASLRTALAQCCGSCAYAGHAAMRDDQVDCTKAGSFYNGKIMEKTARCARWEAA